MLDLAYLRKRLPKQFAQMSDEQLEVCLGELYALANLAVDGVMKRAATKNEEVPHERSIEKG
ncbi:MAG TPA: hypothetical protein VLC46_24910 [Thermoanaerobaculia bacterium]|nr:hypothetical protein [Thermoanaerobaculia bacterium]